MKVSTMRENCKNSDNSFQVIIFYCGPSDNQELVLEIGYNLLNHIEYTNPDGAMFYKADSQTFLRKPKATGNKNISKYGITVPRYWTKVIFFEIYIFYFFPPTFLKTDLFSAKRQFKGIIYTE